jgi:VanZ like family
MRGFLLAASVVLILAFTLTPGRGEFVQPAAFTCDLSRIGPASIATYLSINNVSLNVALFVPLGAAIAVLPGSRRRTALVVLAACMPFAIEAIQSALPDLGRTCQTGDLFDNLAGLVVGLGAGAAALGLPRAIRS